MVFLGSLKSTNSDLGHKLLFMCEFVLERSFIYYNKMSSQSCVLDTMQVSKMSNICDWEEYDLHNKSCKLQNNKWNVEIIRLRRP